MDELLIHFSRWPYLDTGFRFDALEIQAEVAAVSEHFVDRQRLIKSGTSQGWSACALRSFSGNAGAVETETYYGALPRAAREFELTPIAERCPATVRLLNRITSIEYCRRIRFMSLAPGGIIPLHRDSDKDISLVIHCPIVYPPECRYIAKNGKGEFEVVPLKAGGCFLMDISKPHKVSNLSAVGRVSLIVEGAINLSRTQLIQLAQT